MLNNSGHYTGPLKKTYTSILSKGKGGMYGYQGMHASQRGVHGTKWREELEATINYSYEYQKMWLQCDNKNFPVHQNPSFFQERRKASSIKFS